MWEHLEKDLVNECTDCRWHQTSACPHNQHYPNNPLMSLDDKRVYEICHRFVLTNEERERRHEALMRKLSENIIVDGDDDNIPF